ncbi:MAG: riboflavin synthase [Candidatus Nanopelagicales bacterium]
MFTGIIQQIGVVSRIQATGDFGVLEIELTSLPKSVKLGDSISVNGVCLTATSLHENVVSFDVMGITLSKTNLGDLNMKSLVNIEFPMTLTDFVGGHLVQGHIDEVGTILEIEELTNWRRVRIAVSPQLQKYVVKRGSIAVDGVSLTVSDLGDLWFEVSLIPSTLEHTILGSKQVGNKVNLESDIVARHLEKLVNS